MELNEAIIHARQVAEGCGVDNRDCAYQHDQLGDWLEELQAYHAIGTVERLTELVKAEQKRREGCEFCHDQQNLMYYKINEYVICPHCGRDLRGESHDGD